MPIITHPIEEETKKYHQKKNRSERVSSGIAEFDTILNGGFIPGSINLISGCSGSGKTIFCMTYLYNNAVRHNKKGIYITFEEDVNQIRENSKSMGMDFDKVDDKITLMDLPALRKFFTNEEEMSHKNSIMDVDNLIEILERNCKNVDLIALDSIVPLSMKYDNLNSFRAALFKLKVLLKSLKATSIITTEIPSSNINVLSRYDMEDFLSDSVTVLKMGEFEKNINNWFSDKHFSERYLRVHKIRGSDHIKAYVEYRISNTGLMVNLPSTYK